ncbi:hypothetical protein [Cupriavidus necator]|uniref:hypothetical protein n=1 Tax=Cupriavidus necator TaxID=106590 RepID=UPI00339D90A2
MDVIVLTQALRYRIPADAGPTAPTRSGDKANGVLADPPRFRRFAAKAAPRALCGLYRRLTMNGKQNNKKSAYIS